MALFQAGLVRDLLHKTHAGLAAELVPIHTTGDRVLNRRLAEIGGKGLFTKEIEEALLDRRIDLAVHSLKDMETVLPAGLGIGCVLKRDDPRDALVSRTGATLAGLPLGVRVGTASLRRRAQLLRTRSDLDIVSVRGNVGTRLAKLAAGEVEALVLALCGLQRLGKRDLVTMILPPETMLPAVGQGALAIECRTADELAQQLIAPLNDPDSAVCVAAERAMLAALDGSCHTPIAGLATIADGLLSIEALLLAPDGSAERRDRAAGPVSDAAAIGAELGERLRRRAGPQFGFT